jgi:hypothetical protein
LTRDKAIESIQIWRKVRKITVEMESGTSQKFSREDLEIIHAFAGNYTSDFLPLLAFIASLPVVKTDEKDEEITQ